MTADEPPDSAPHSAPDTGPDALAVGRWDDDRHESRTEKLDRNWSELLQELRVTQTGVQLLTAFLLSLPFQNRFSTITAPEKVLYLVVLLLSVGATAFLIMPVSMHRAVFRLHDKERLVTVAGSMAKVGLLLLALAVTGVVLLIFSVAVSWTAAGVTGGVTLGVFTTLWLVVPMTLRRHAVRAAHRQE